VANGAYTGTIEDMEHVVIFMQENRPFDHYYGTLSGVRGFNDRAHPPLKTGKSIWHQPIEHFQPENAFCGCSACDFKWKEFRGELKDLLTMMPCDHFVNTMEGADPSVPIVDGQSCQDMM
jgi:hypothetical protein